MAKAFSPERRVASLVDRLRIWVSITCSTPSPAPRTYTGFLAQSLARSARVMTTAPPASVTRQMFKTLKGQTTGRESSTSCTVIGSRFLALGLRAAHLRVDTATCAHCSRVVPYSCMWRVVMRPNMVGAPPKPYGVSNCPGSAVSRRGVTPTPERPDSPWAITATSQRPWWRATMAWPTMMMKEQPPTVVPST